jgi:Peptidase M50B-like
MTGGTITRMSIDPILGGFTTVQGGHPPSILCAGYVGSTVLGGLFILGGFDSLAAKILSFVAGVGLIAPLSLVRDKMYVRRRLGYTRKRFCLTRVTERFCSLWYMRVCWWDSGSLITRAHGHPLFGSWIPAYEDYL